LEQRGHCFCRYADDCNIYVRTERAGQRAMDGLSRFLEERLKLKVNRAKSAVARPWERKFLGYSFTAEPDARLRLPEVSRRRFRDRIRAVLKANRGRSLSQVIEQLNPLLRGWITYFRHLETPSVLSTLDGWIRRKLRCILWRQWKRVVSKARNLMRLGLDEVRAWRSATNGRGAWWNAGASHMNAATPKPWFDRLQLVSLVDTHQHLSACHLNRRMRNRTSGGVGGR
jgi:RNA-directed DNA polymerase